MYELANLENCTYMHIRMNANSEMLRWYRLDSRLAANRLPY